jgi:peptidoglycan/xylan/chitin deacetylase (PgdA/CDA1 family)
MWRTDEAGIDELLEFVSTARGGKIMASGSACVFLMYHELELPGRVLCQSEPGYVRYVLAIDEFASQMQQLSELGLLAVSVSDALKFTGRTIAITFDDGCETDLLSAALILKGHNFGATFFVVSGFVGKPGYLSQPQLRELATLGFEIGCHSMTHPYLPDLDDAGLRHEIVEAKNALEQMLGKPVEHFSCPGGRYDSRAMQVAENAGFVTVSTSVPRANTAKTNKLSLNRVPITRGMKAPEFQQLCRGESLWKLNLRNEARNRVKRLLGNAIYDRLRSSLLDR